MHRTPWDGDPVAAKTSWKPAKRGGISVRSHESIREGSDRGKPPASGEDALAKPFHEIAAKVDAWIGAQS